MIYSWLPELLAEIAEVAGLEAALQLAKAHGGTRKRIPAWVPNRQHWLPDCVGRPAAEKICAHYRQRSGSDQWRGVYILIPLGPTGAIASVRRCLAMAIAEGKSASEAARLAGMTERAAYRARSRARGNDDKQGSLF